MRCSSKRSGDDGVPDSDDRGRKRCRLRWWAGDRALLRFRLLCAGCPLCSDRSHFGIMPGAGGTEPAARCWCSTSQNHSDRHAFQRCRRDGLGRNKLCAEGKLLEDALATAEKIAGNAPISARQAKKAIDMSTQLDLKSGYAFELGLIAWSRPRTGWRGCGPSTKSERRFKGK